MSGHRTFLQAVSHFPETNVCSSAFNFGEFIGRRKPRLPTGNNDRILITVNFLIASHATRWHWPSGESGPGPVARLSPSDSRIGRYCVHKIKRPLGLSRCARRSMSTAGFYQGLLARGKAK